MNATMIHPLELILEQVNGSSFISISTVTTPTLLGGKGNAMQGRVTKHMSGANVMVFSNKRSNGYENMVTRRLVQEGKNPAFFELQPRKWGKRIEGKPIVEHNGELYLEVIFLRAGKATYKLDGGDIDPSLIVGLREPEEAEQGGLDDKVIIRTFKFSSIEAITIDKQHHILR